MTNSTLSFTDISKPCLSREILTAQICLLTLFVKIKFSRSFRIYSMTVCVLYLLLTLPWFVCSLQLLQILIIYTGSYTSAHVLLNLLKRQGKEIKCEACRALYLFFTTSLINSIIHEHECQNIFIT